MNSEGFLDGEFHPTLRIGGAVYYDLKLDDIDMAQISKASQKQLDDAICEAVASHNRAMQLRGEFNELE